MGQLHYDIGRLAPCRRLPNGTIVAEAHLTRSGIFSYRNPDGSERKELRLPEEVFRPDSMRTFAMVPATDDHPPEMIDATNATTYAKGATSDTVVRDDDHLRSLIAVYDAKTIAKMDAGKIEVSCGYTCDLDETPGVHPLWGAYDAIQRNIVGNHVALVDTGRAGSTASVRMDAAMQLAKPRKSSGTRLASRQVRGTLPASMATVPNARIDVVVRHDGPLSSATAVVDPNDLANRNARGETNADDDDDPDQDRDDDEPNPPDDPDPAYETDATCGGMYDADGNLTELGAKRVATSSFAMPGKQRLPIHDPAAVRDSMRKFSTTEFDDADEKHGAFNRISGRAKQFGINSDAFRRANAKKLDRKDAAMIHADMQAKLAKKTAKADKRKAEIAALTVRADKADAALAASEGKVASLTADLKAATDKIEGSRTDAAEKFDTAVAAKVDLIVKATGVLGADKVSAKTSDLDIMKSVIKHVDGKDVTDPRPAYVEALFEGAIERHRKDAAATGAGASALAAARAATVTAPAVPGAPAPAPHADAADGEDAARAAMIARARTASEQPGRHTKDALFASRNRS